ncbi:rod shape-determining protein RodA [Lipingzhangella sp. LS1_29]|uniref:peptidoglycan glycosyltransferase n=1 Tax=Lipingzhangella rawalii TaxID=2055835 RepID=A0ABU2H740_9ACTN|nr:rod shape-determining protein RodA [Lipingzhangella rawalii]MDS1271120.1 rod shape-determining protein RodA [Lipingzhangella rawalii]
MAPAGWRGALCRVVAERPRRVDWVLVGAVGLLSILGTLLVWAAGGDTVPGRGTDPQEGDAAALALVQRHATHVAVGAVLCFALAAVDYRMQRAYAPVIYAATLLGLALVLTPLGAEINGSRGWLVVGGVQAQPSELAKVGVILFVAMLLGEPRDGETAPSNRDVLVSLVAVSVPLALVVTQPDLGTALVLAVTFLGMLALSGAPLLWLVGMGLSCVTAALAVWWFDLLQPYQLERVATLIDPTADPAGSGYNANQALIAVGSGGVNGTGLFHGGQTSGHFVPEQHTDFVFTVVAEELGFVGGATVLLLLGVVVWRVLRIGADCEQPFARLVCVGVAVWLLFQSAVNIGMCLGVMPVTGLPLPFLSYGGTATLAQLAAVGLVLGVHARDRGFE